MSDDRSWAAVLLDRLREHFLESEPERVDRIVAWLAERDADPLRSPGWGHVITDATEEE